MKDDGRWIVICNWDRFQHPDATRSENIPWIRNYTRLLKDYNYLDLTEHRALILHRLWLEYASTRCRLRVDTASLSRRLSLRVTMSDLEALNHAGFLEFLQADRLQDAGDLARTREKEREKEKELTTNDERVVRPPARIDGFESVGDLAAAILERSHP